MPNHKNRTPNINFMGIHELFNVFNLHYLAGNQEYRGE